jgi:Bacterial PH domain
MLNPEPEIQRLIGVRPASHQTGTFPREYLPPGEAVLFETRPSLWAYISPVLGGGIVLFLLGLLFWAESVSISNAVGDGTSGMLWQVLAVLLIVLGVVAIAAGLIGWYFTSYAVTNRRIIRKNGWMSRRVIDARLDKIQCVTMTDTVGTRVRGFGHILFSLSTLSPPWSPFSGVQMGGILWRAVPDPVQLRAFIEDVFETFARFDRSGQRVILEES